MTDQKKNKEQNAVRKNERTKATPGKMNISGKTLNELIGFVSVLSDEFPLDAPTANKVGCCFKNPAHSAMGKVTYTLDGAKPGEGIVCVDSNSLAAIAKFAGPDDVKLAVDGSEKVTVIVGKMRTVLQHIADYGACKMPSFKHESSFITFESETQLNALLKLYKECGYSELEIISTKSDVQFHGTNGINTSSAYIEAKSQQGKARAVYDLGIIIALVSKLGDCITWEMLDSGPIRLKSIVGSFSIEYVLAPIIVEGKEVNTDETKNSKVEGNEKSE